jgi:hypothetical protein
VINPPGQRPVQANQGEEGGILVYPVINIDTTDKIMGIPVKHFVAGAFAALATSFLGSNSFLGLILIPVAGYVVYRVSLQLEKRFPGTSFRYYLKWIQGAQLYYPGPDEIAAPLVVPDEVL